MSSWSDDEQSDDEQRLLDELAEVTAERDFWAERTDANGRMPPITDEQYERWRLAASAAGPEVLERFEKLVKRAGR